MAADLNRWRTERTPTPMREITEETVLKYIAEHARATIEDDMVEVSYWDWTDEELEVLREKAMAWIHDRSAHAAHAAVLPVSGATARAALDHPIDTPGGTP